MNYRQLNGEDRRVLAALRSVGVSQAGIARQLMRHRSTVFKDRDSQAFPLSNYFVFCR